jgi:hypothetical protein
MFGPIDVTGNREATGYEEAAMTGLRFLAGRFLLGPPLVLLAAVIAHAEVGNADTLRRIAQAEKDAGRVSSFRVMETYRAIGVTTAPPATRASTEVSAEVAREWAKRFCAAAAQDYQWDHRWRLTVYAHGQPRPAYTCSIRNTAHLERSLSSEGRVACDDKGNFEPVDETE